MADAINVLRGADWLRNCFMLIFPTQISMNNRVGYATTSRNADRKLFISDFLPMVPPSPRLRRGKKALVQAMTCRNADRKLSISDFLPMVRRM